MAVRNNLFSYTPPGGNYPGYVSINRDERGVEVTVRSAPTINADCYGHDVLAGQTASFIVPAEEWAKFITEANDVPNG